MAYRHNGKTYNSLDDLCEAGVIVAIRLYTLLSEEPAYFADTDDAQGWQINQEQAVYLAGKYFNNDIETV